MFAEGVYVLFDLADAAVHFGIHQLLLEVFSAKRMEDEENINNVCEMSDVMCYDLMMLI